MPSRVPVQDVRVEHRGEEVVRRGDRVEVAGEVEVEVLHRHDLRWPPPAAPPLTPKTGPSEASRRQRNGRSPDARKPLRERDRSRRLALAGGVGVIAVTAISLPSGASARRSRTERLTLAFVRPYGSSSSGSIPSSEATVDDRPQRGRLRDLEARRHRAIVAHRRACTAAHPTGMTRHVRRRLDDRASTRQLRDGSVRSGGAPALPGAAHLTDGSTKESNAGGRESSAAGVIALTLPGGRLTCEACSCGRYDRARAPRRT